jgi:phosphoglycolate phosphatase
MPFPHAVIFDLDGTLVDSAGDIAEALNASVAPLAGGNFDHADVKQMIGGGSMVLIRKALDSRGVTLSDGDWSATLDRFMRAYKDVSAEGRGLYPGARELLGALHDAGTRIGLCTNKPEVVTHIAVKALGLADRMHAVVGAREDIPKKPDPTMLLKTITLMRCEVAGAVMVGDSMPDVVAAKAAGVASVILRHGYSKVPVESLGADRVLDDLITLRTELAHWR